MLLTSKDNVQQKLYTILVVNLVLIQASTPVKDFILIAWLPG